MPFTPPVRCDHIDYDQPDREQVECLFPAIMRVEALVVDLGLITFNACLVHLPEAQSDPNVTSLVPFS